jgi:uncharacterized protein (TIGR02453 family)
MATSFRGWPQEGVEFLRDLEDNNDRDWFKANRSRREDFLVAPALALAGDLAEFGSPHVFRPWNDTRFHHRPPIKEHLGMTIGYEGAGGWYIELSLDGLVVAAGLHRPARDQLERIRQGIDGARTAAALDRALAVAAGAGMSLPEPQLKRAPRGYPADHPRLDLLRLGSLTVSRRDDLRGWIHKPEAGRRIRERVEAARPLVEWLRKHVGPTQLPDRRR